MAFSTLEFIVCFYPYVESVLEFSFLFGVSGHSITCSVVAMYSSESVGRGPGAHERHWLRIPIDYVENPSTFLQAGSSIVAVSSD